MYSKTFTKINFNNQDDKIMNNIRIALIDTGISKEYCRNKKINVHHSHVNNNIIVDGYKQPVDNHAELCADMILRDDFPSFELFDICVMDNLEKISESALISGIKKAISEHVDIINLSLGYNIYSPKLFKVCEEAIENNIVIIAAASHGGEIFYPANLKNVVCVKISENQQKLFETIDSSTISVSDKIPIPFFKKEELFSTSFAAAYFSGELGRLLNGYPFFDKFVILKNKFNLKLSDSLNSVPKLQHEKSEIYKILETSKNAVVFDPCEDVENFYKDKIHPNIVAYYDYQSSSFKNFSLQNEKDVDFDNIFIINTLSHDIKMVIPSDIQTCFPKQKIFFIGNFKRILNEPIMILLSSGY